MKQFLAYGFYILPAAVLIASCNWGGPQLPNLKESFSKNDRIPFGTYVAHKQLQQLYQTNNINLNTSNIAAAFSSNNDTASLYVNISKNFYLSKPDLNMLLNFISNGNTVLISSQFIDSSFLDTIGLIQNPISTRALNEQPQFQVTASRLDSALYEDSSWYRYYYYPLRSFFNSKDSGNQYILGANENNKPNFVAAGFGKGRIYLHCEPRLFSNYFLLQKNNYQYFQKVFAYLPQSPDYIYWDDYYCKRNRAPSDKGNRSGLSVLLQYPPLAWALWLVIAGLLLYILLGGKRRQRIINPVPKNKNTSLAFTETVGRLYLQKKDNRNLADKMICFFLEHIRNKYFLNTAHFNDDFIDTLSRKSNVTKIATIQLFTLISELQQSAKITDNQLLSLNDQIEKFYKQQ